MIEPSYKVGSRGYMIGVIQRALGVPDDNKFGNITRNAIIDLQKKKMMKETGEASASVFKALGLRWPDPFDRCMQIVDAFEGTGFGGMNDFDIDGWGITLGILGYTSKNGEVQKILREYINRNPTALHALSSSTRQAFESLIKNPSSTNQQWFNLFYVAGKTAKDTHPRREMKAALRIWGRDYLFQEIQLVRALNFYWKPAVDNAIKLGLKSTQGMGLMFDIHVQNGGWRAEHQSRFLSESQDGTEGAKLRAIARAVAASANPKWKDVVLARKMTYAMGFGRVNQENFDLINYAFEPLEVPK